MSCREQESEITLGWRLVRELEPQDQMFVDFSVVPADAGRCFFMFLLRFASWSCCETRCTMFVFIQIMQTLWHSQFSRLFTTQVHSKKPSCVFLTLSRILKVAVLVCCSSRFKLAKVGTGCFPEEARLEGWIQGHRHTQDEAGTDTHTHIPILGGVLQPRTNYHVQGWLPKWDSCNATIYSPITDYNRIVPYLLNPQDSKSLFCIAGDSDASRKGNGSQGGGRLCVSRASGL